MPKYVILLEASKRETSDQFGQANQSHNAGYTKSPTSCGVNIVNPNKSSHEPNGVRKIFDIDASIWASRRDIYRAILPILEAPEGYCGGINGLFEWMFWDERATVEPPYVVQLHGTAGLPRDVSEELGWILEGVTKSREWEAERGRLVEAYIEIVS